MTYVKGSEIREPHHDISPIFLDRWSPRAMSGEELSDEDLFELFEAARWAPSRSNEQPWRFVYVKRETDNWGKIFDCLDDFNRIWTINSAVLVCLLAYKNLKDGTPNRNALSDSGAAWENLALQASLKGLVCHGMAGYDIDKIKSNLNIPEDYEVVHIIAIGKTGDLNMIPERMRKSEKPSDRKPISDFIFEGEFRK